MSFLNPLALWGLAAAAIPLLIHLFQFQRPRRVSFSSVSFVKALEQTTIRRMKVRRWLLLLLRTLAILSLVLAFARPTLTGPVAGTFGGRATSASALVLDNSHSMTTRASGATLLERAREAGGTIVDQMSEGDEIHLWPTAGGDSLEGTRTTIPSAARQTLSDVGPAPGARSLTRTAREAARSIADRSQFNRELYLIGDLQRTTLVDTTEASVSEDVRVHLVPISGPETGNVAVTDVRVVSRIVEVGRPVEMEATIANFGSQTRDDLVASVYLDEDRVAQSTATVEPGTRETVTFTTVPQRRGWLTGRVQLEEDDYPRDDRRRFVLHVPRQRSVLVVAGEEATTRYLDLVLSAPLTESGPSFRVERLREDQLPGRDLAGYDAVILAGVRDLSSGETESIARYVESGGGLFFYPSSQAVAADYNRLLERMEAGQFTGFVGSLGARQSIASVESADLEHPLFRAMFATTQRRTSLQIERVPVYFTMNYRPGGGNEQTLIALSSGAPFLQEIRHGEGRVLLSAVFPHTSWSALPVRGLFVPLTYRSLYYLSAGGADVSAEYEIGRDGELRVRAGPQESSVRIVGPSGEEYLPEQQSVLGTTRFQVGSFMDRPGFYEIRRGEELIRRVAVNPSSTESDLSTYSSEEAADRLEDALGNPVQVLAAGEPTAVSALGETVRQQRYGVELWNVFLLLALAFLAAEMMVSTYRPSAEVSA